MKMISAWAIRYGATGEDALICVQADSHKAAKDALEARGYKIDDLFGIRPVTIFPGHPVPFDWSADG